MFFLRPQRVLFMATSREGYESIYDTIFCQICQIYFCFFVVVGRECIRPCRMARDRPSPYGEEGVFFRSAVACPPRSFGRPEPGEGQALALRE